jgi:HEAT repeats
MSIAVLTQVYDEMRRLAIAGSVAAGGDFRLKKLIPPLEQAGTKAPVFAKVAQAVKALVEGTEQSSAPALLELCTLVNAILYTQGETGLAGGWAEIASTDLGPQTSQVSAGLLKPLLEALATTGSGRVEIIKDSFERAAFRDLRLVKPALDAIDDPYPEVGEFIARKVLPLYGKAILPDLKSRFDLKSTKAGHLRRLALMHELDPAGSRVLVKQALEDGSKEIKIAAIECLGDSAEDLAFLLEQSSVKNKEIRRAALKALAKQDSDAAIEALRKAMMGADLDIATQPIQKSRSPKLLKAVIDEAGGKLEVLFKTKNTSKEKNEVGKGVERLLALLSCLEGRDDSATEQFLVTLFQRRKEIQGLKGEPDGTAISDEVATLMRKGSPTVQRMLADAHASLSSDILGTAFEAARESMSPAEVFEVFSPYVLAKVDEKKKARDPAWAKREAVVNTITGDSVGLFGLDEPTERPEKKTWDPRWLDVAIAIGSAVLTCHLARPNHEGCKAHLSKLLASVRKDSKATTASIVEPVNILQAMFRIEHPEAIPCLIEEIKRLDNGKYAYYNYWLWNLVRRLPKSAVAPLEALLPALREQTADQLLKHLNALKNKP